MPHQRKHQIIDLEITVLELDKLKQGNTVYKWRAGQKYAIHGYVKSPIEMKIERLERELFALRKGTKIFRAKENAPYSYKGLARKKGPYVKRNLEFWAKKSQQWKGGVGAELRAKAHEKVNQNQ